MDPTILNVLMALSLVAGSGLVILEAFIPGFGVAGISGVILDAAGIWLAFTGHGTGFALTMTGLALAVIGISVWMSYRSAMKGRLSRSPLILKDQEQAGQQADTGAWLGREGTAVSALRPGGFVTIDGTKLNAASEGDWIGKGEKVRVTGAENGTLLVKKS